MTTPRPERLLRAMRLVTAGQVRVVGPQQFRVGQYDVDLNGEPRCYCRDMEFRRIEFCKHQLAAMLATTYAPLRASIADWLDATATTKEPSG